MSGTFNIQHSTFSAQQKLTLLAGTIWNLKRWIELKQWAQRTGNLESFKHALEGIARCKDTCRKVRGLAVGGTFNVQHSTPNFEV